MVDFGTYKKENSEYVNVNLVKSLAPSQRKAVVTGEGGWTEFNNETPAGIVVEKKPYIEISISTKIYKWTLSKTAFKMLCEGFGSSESNDWVGGVISLSIIPVNGKETVGAFVLEKKDN
jgi:hypothetical protein